MENLYFIDELQCALAALQTRNIRLNSYINKQINIVCDSHYLAAYLGGFFSLYKTKTKCFSSEINIISDQAPKTNLYDEISSEFADVKLNFYSNLANYLSDDKVQGEKVFIYIHDLNLSKNQAETIANLQAYLKIAGEKNADFLFCPIFNFNKPVEAGIFAVAEKELEAVVKNDDSFTQGKLLIELEKICSEAFKKYNNFLSVVRFDTIFGPCFESNSKLGLEKIIDDLKVNNEIVFKKSDSQIKYSACYITDAITAILTVLAKGNKGNIYNASEYEFSIHEFKSILLEKFLSYSPNVSFIDENCDSNSVGYERLSGDKLKCISWNSSISFKEAVYKTACQKMDVDFIGEFYNDVYHGKLERIKQLEMDLIERVDKICKANDINYFLVGGSMLGAVRHGGFIPWDDDIDIGMLREDYDKFRKICSENLDDAAFFQYYKQDKQTHYIFDKVRLVGTYFNSELSKNFPKQENGIFIDILVYDKTSNKALFQKLHIFQVRLMKLILNILWLDQIKQQSHKTLSKLILPVLKILPFSFYHWCLDKSLALYKNKKNSQFLIDGVGINILKGVLPIRWLSEYTDIEFEGKIFKISKYYDEYLTMLFGKDYMNLLPYSSRNSGHTLVRLDLGKYLFKTTENQDVSKNDLQGELY